MTVLAALSILFAGASLALLAQFFIQLRRLPAPGEISRQALVALVVVCGLNGAHDGVMALLGWNRDHTQPFWEPIEFLLPPVLSGYGAAATGVLTRWRLRHVLHSVPFVAAVLVAVVSTVRGHAVPGATLFFWSALTAQMIAYAVPFFRRFHRYHERLKDVVSNWPRAALGWFETFLVVVLGLCALPVVVVVLVLHDLPSPLLGSAVSLTMLVALFVLGTRGVEHRTPVLVSSPAPVVAADEARELGRRLERLLERDRPFRDPDLDLQGLAARLGVSRNVLSSVIHSEFHQSFYDLVHSWRLKEFQRLLADPRWRDEKLLTLALEAGFPSKATFNKVVLSQTGLTPSQLRERTIVS